MPAKTTVLALILIAAPMGSLTSAAQRPADDLFLRGLVLKRVREYCRRLERAALDFVCYEEISETLDTSRESQKAAVRIDPRMTSGVGGVGRMGLSGRPFTFEPSTPRKGDHRYLIDYQFVRKEGRVEEKRILLEEDGKKVRRKESPAQMSVFSCSDMLLMPVKLLDEKVEEFYSYRILREDDLAGTKVWILDISPRLSIDGYLGGQLWISQADFQVLKIEWDPTTFGRYEAIRQNAARYQGSAAVTSFTEFGVEKNGLRFPSRDETEEAYLNAAGEKFVRSRTQVTFTNYRFFTVETETTFKR
jgi:hypothetical protein